MLCIKKNIIMYLNMCYTIKFLINIIHILKYNIGTIILFLNSKYILIINITDF